jgi:Transposase DDE domain group 1
VWCDNTSECLAIELRPGNAGANTAVDHITVLGAAIRQVPAAHRRRLLVRADGAGCIHALLDWLVANNQIRGRGVEFSVGFAATEHVRAAIRLVPAQAWTPAIDADGQPREGGDVAEVTGLLDLSGYPQCAGWQGPVVGRDASWIGRDGDLLVIPDSRHSLEALEDSEVLLTVAKAP